VGDIERVGRRHELDRRRLIGLGLDRARRGLDRARPDGELIANR